MVVVEKTLIIIQFLQTIVNLYQQQVFTQHFSVILHYPMSSIKIS